MGEIDDLLGQLRSEGTIPEMPSRTFRPVFTLEAALFRNGEADRAPAAFGWPSELEHSLLTLRQAEEHLASELRRLVIARALEPNLEVRLRLVDHIREKLRRLRRYVRREEFLFLKAFWLDLGIAG